MYGQMVALKQEMLFDDQEELLRDTTKNARSVACLPGFGIEHVCVAHLLLYTDIRDVARVK